MSRVNKTSEEMGEVVPPTMTDEEVQSKLEEMQAQIQYFKEAAERAGHTFAPPPNAVNVEEEPILSPGEKALREGRPRPGTTMGSGPHASIVPWSREDLDPRDVVTFTPEPVASIMYPLKDEEGRGKMYLNVNGLGCWLTLNTVNKVSRIFYETYLNLLQQNKELQQLQMKGPDGMPWGRTTSDGKPTWHSVQGAQSFGMDVDGRWLPNTPGE